MKSMFVSALFLVSLFATAQESFTSSVLSPSHNFKPISSKAGIFSSDWEGANNWVKVSQNTKTAILSHKKQLLQIDQRIIDNGLAVVFIKGYSFGAAPEKPMSLPFTYFSSDEVLSEGVNWHAQISSGTAEVQLALPASLENQFLSGKDGVQFRYFILSPQFFKEKNTTPVQVKSLSYKNFISLLDTTE